MQQGNSNEEIKALFLDIGGVILTNGWDHTSRNLAAEKFRLDKEEMSERHHLTFDTYEEGKLTLDEYLKRVVFYERRDFSKEEFISFMFDQSKAFEETLQFFKDLKQQYNLRVFAVNNEGRELNEFRIKKFKLNELFDSYISSCYLHLRKPDMDMFRMACDISQTTPSQALYIEDRLMFVEVARSFGIRAHHFEDFKKAKDFIDSCKFYKQPKK